MLGLNYLRPKAPLIKGGAVATASGDESVRNLTGDPGLYQEGVVSVHELYIDLASICSASVSNF